MNKYLAESFGTFGLVLCGTGAIVLHNETGNVSHLGISLSFGLIVFAMVELLGNTSGAHINPAVTIALGAAGLFPKKEIVPYLLSQIAGAVLASFLLNFLFPTDELLGTTLPTNSAIQAFGIEIFLTFVLMLTILLLSRYTRKRKLVTGFVIGTVIFLEAYFAGPITGASMNPARSFAPALVSGHFEHLWVYISAPVLGGLLAIFGFRFILSNNSKSENRKLNS